MQDALNISLGMIYQGVGFTHMISQQVVICGRPLMSLTTISAK